jgi:hypothetical protein
MNTFIHSLTRLLKNVSLQMAYKKKNSALAEKQELSDDKKQ